MNRRTFVKASLVSALFSPRYTEDRSLIEPLFNSPVYPGNDTHAVCLGDYNTHAVCLGDYDLRENNESAASGVPSRPSLVAQIWQLGRTAKIEGSESHGYVIAYLVVDCDVLNLLTNEAEKRRWVELELMYMAAEMKDFSVMLESGNSEEMKIVTTRNNEIWHPGLPSYTTSNGITLERISRKPSVRIGGLFSPSSFKFWAVRFGSATEEAEANGITWPNNH